MKILKELTLSLLGFLLFLCLSIFGLAFMLNGTILNPDFVTSEVERLDVSSLVEEVIGEQVDKGEFPEEFGAAIVKNVTKLEPLVKEQISSATYSIYDYLLGKSLNLNLASTLRDTLLSTDFVVSLIDELDVAPIAAEMLSGELAGEIPIDREDLAGYLEDAIREVEPQVKEEVSAAADPMLDYLLGQRQSFTIEISLEPMKAGLENNLREAFLQSPPAGFAGAPRSQLEIFFNEFYREFSTQIPSTFELDETIIGTEAPVEIARGLAEAEVALEQGRLFVSYFQLGYKALIGLMLLLVLGIVLLDRQVKSATRRLGIPLMTYGALWYASNFVAKYFISKYFAGAWLPLPEIPASLQTWIIQLPDNFLAPFSMFSLGLLIGGIVLIVVSFVYKPREA